MDKLTMAHDWAMKYGSPENFRLTVDEAWEYADAMQAEADKRKEKGVPDEILKASNSRELEWQPDWSQAPEWAKYWIKTSGGSFAWLDRKPDISKINPHWNVECFKKSFAPSFNYQGDWQDSLRKRPEGK